MRGAQIRNFLYSILVGIIPAYAGSTEYKGGKLTIVGDHPRVCGEHRLDSAEESIRGGSSPRMRGAHVCDCLRQTKDQDHPRVCGEHEVIVKEAEPGEGSSPRMRGAL